MGPVALGVAAVLLAGARGPATSATAVARAPDVVLVTLDTVRADRMGFLGSRRGLTPALDALARQAVTFEAAYAQAPLTTVSTPASSPAPGRRGTACATSACPCRPPCPTFPPG